MNKMRLCCVVSDRARGACWLAAHEQMKIVHFYVCKSSRKLNSTYPGKLLYVHMYVKRTRQTKAMFEISSKTGYVLLSKSLSFLDQLQFMAETIRLVTVYKLTTRIISWVVCLPKAWLLGWWHVVTTVRYRTYHALETSCPTWFTFQSPVHSHTSRPRYTTSYYT